MGRGGRFLASLLKRKRPANTQPFMPGSQVRPWICWHVPFNSCGQPQPLIDFLSSQNETPPIREASDPRRRLIMRLARIQTRRRRSAKILLGEDGAWLIVMVTNLLGTNATNIARGRKYISRLLLGLLGTLLRLRLLRALRLLGLLRALRLLTAPFALGEVTLQSLGSLITVPLAS